MFTAVLFVFLVASGCCNALSRKVAVKEYACNITQCQDNPQYRLVHVKSFIPGNDTQDTIHYVWAAIDVPAIIVAHGMNSSSELVIDWQAILARKTVPGIKFHPPVHSASAMTIGRLFEYKDAKDSVDPFQSGNTVLDEVHADFKWQLVSVDANNAQATFAANSTGAHTNGSVEFQLKAYSSSGHRNDWPHETYNANSSEFTYTFKGLSCHVKESRYFIEVVMYTEKPVSQLSFETDKSLDDEYTPGIFKLWKLAIPTNRISSFVSWKPVGYISPSRDRAQQTFAYNFPSGSKGDLSRAVGNLWSIASVALHKPVGFGVNVSFGMSSDEFYHTYNYVSWTGLIGLGTPPAEEMSPLVITVIIVGLGVPAFFIIVGFGFVFIKRLRNNRRSNYDQIN